MEKFYIYTCKYVFVNLYTQEIEKQIAVRHSKMTKYLNK